MRNFAVVRFALLPALLVLAGCSHYEYEIVQPPTLARHIGEKMVTVVPDDPLVYRFQAVDNHLVMWIENPTSDPIRLVGDKSVVVDPGNRSHPLGSQTIAAGSFIELVLPPPSYWEADYDYPVFVSARLGYGAYPYGRYPYYHYPYRYPYYRGYYYGGFYYDDYWPPPYVVVYDQGPYGFAWEGQTDVRITLSFERAGKAFSHNFVFHQEKVG